MIDSKILREIIKDSRIISQQELINKYKIKNIEIEYPLNKTGFIVITDKNDGRTFNTDIKEINKYFDDIDNLIDNMSNEQFEKLLIESGIENCPYYEK